MNFAGDFFSCAQIFINIFRTHLPNLCSQYIITKNLNLQGAVATYSLESYGTGLALVMEDFPGIPLLDYSEKSYQKLLAGDLTEFWQIASQITEILEQSNSTN